MVACVRSPIEVFLNWLANCLTSVLLLIHGNNVRLFNKFPLIVLFLTYCLALSAQEDQSNADLLEELANQFANQEDNLIEGRFSVDEELLFETYLAGIELGPLLAVTKQSGIQLNLESYIEVMDFPIKFNRQELSYQGWFIEETRTFNLPLDFTNSESEIILLLSERELVIPAENYSYQNDELYINANILSQIFGIKHNFNYQKLTLEARPNGKFPLLDKLRREGRVISNRNTKPSFVNLPRYYEVLSPQILDIQLNTRYQEKLDRLDSSYSVIAARDVALLNTQLALTGSSENGITNGRLTFSRDSVGGKLFGDTGITRIAVGDVRNVRQANGGTLSESLGVTIQNTDIVNLFDSEFITVDGDIPTGWDVELYRNGRLLGQKTSVEEGRYEFLDVPLIYGKNNFELILYGPQGQVTRRTFSRLVDESITSKKDFTYQASLTKINTTMLGINERNFDADQGYNFSSRGNIFLFDGVGLNVGLQSRFGSEKDSSVFSVGSSAAVLNNSLLSASLSFNSNDALGFGASLRSRVGNQSLSANYSTGNLKNADNFLATFSLEGPIDIGGGFTVPVSNSVSFTQTNDNKRFVYSNALGLRFSRFSMFHNIEYERIENDLTSNERTSAGLNLQANLGQFYTRLSASYVPSDSDILKAISASVSWQPVGNFRLNFSSVLDTINDSLSNDLNLSYLGDNFRINGSVRDSDIGGLNIGVSASFTMKGQHLDYDDIVTGAFSSSQSGSLSVRVFFDKNLNAIFDDGDFVLPDVKVEGVQFFRTATTDENGIAVLDRLPNHVSSDIRIDEATLPEGFLVPLVEGVSITARSGLVDNLDFPVVVSSEIEGIAEIESLGSLAPLPRAKLDLFNLQGQKIKETTTEYDGYFFIEGVVPGTYLLKLNPSEYERLDLIEMPTIEIIVTTEPDFIVKDFTVRQKEYVGGFINELARFESKQAALLFTVALENRAALPTLYVEKSKETGAFHVFSSFATNSQQAEESCVPFNNIVTSCTSVPFKIAK